MNRATYTIMTFFVSLLLVVISCDNYEPPASPYPRIQSLPIINSSDVSMIFQANIVFIGDQKITDHGFVWGINEYISVGSKNKIRLGEISTTGVFEADCTYAFKSDSIYFVKPFISTGVYEVYGQIISFRK